MSPLQPKFVEISPNVILQKVLRKLELRLQQYQRLVSAQISGGHRFCSQNLFALCAPNFVQSPVDNRTLGPRAKVL